MLRHPSPVDQDHHPRLLQSERGNDVPAVTAQIVVGEQRAGVLLLMADVEATARRDHKLAIVQELAGQLKKRAKVE